MLVKDSEAGQRKYWFNKRRVTGKKLSVIIQLLDMLKGNDLGS